MLSPREHGGWGVCPVLRLEARAKQHALCHMSMPLSLYSTNSESDAGAALSKLPPQKCFPLLANHPVSASNPMATVTQSVKPKAQEVVLPPPLSKQTKKK